VTTRHLSPEACERMSQAAKERWASRTDIEVAQIRVNMSKAVVKGLASMAPEAKKEMFSNISRSLSELSVEEKKAWGDKISVSNRTTNIERLNALDVLDVSEGFGEWFTGFFEGDGSVTCLESVNSMGTGLTFRPEVNFTQKDEDVVSCIKSVLSSGRVSLVSRRQGNYYQVRWSGQTLCIPVIKLLSQRVVTEASCSRLNAVLSRLHLPLASTHELTLGWIVGFWDAEGSIEDPNGSVGSSVLSFSQKDNSILYRIRSFLGVGRVHCPPAGSRLTIRRSEGNVLAEAILKYSHIERKKTMLSERWYE